MNRAIALSIICASAVAHAELTAAELQKTGEDLAKAGRYAEAIDAFKAADKKEIRASHACLIALAYARKNAWTPAEIWDGICRARASKTDPLPEWQSALAEQITAAVGQLVPVSFAVEPAAAQLALDEFPDSPFSSTTIHLSPGVHAVTARAPGYLDDHRSLTVTGTPQQVAIQLIPRPLPRTTYNKQLVVAGTIVGGLGVVSYGLMAYAYHQLDRNKGFGTSTETLYDVTRPTTIGLWAIGGGMVITGLLLRHTESAPTVAVTPVASGAIVSIGWQR